jgi:hypothetical protein
VDGADRQQRGNFPVKLRRDCVDGPITKRLELGRERENRHYIPHLLLAWRSAMGLHCCVMQLLAIALGMEWRLRTYGKPDTGKIVDSYRMNIL